GREGSRVPEPDGRDAAEGREGLSRRGARPGGTDRQEARGPHGADEGEARLARVGAREGRRAGGPRDLPRQEGGLHGVPHGGRAGGQGRAGSFQERLAPGGPATPPRD